MSARRPRPSSGSIPHDAVSAAGPNAARNGWVVVRSGCSTPQNIRQINDCSRPASMRSAFQPLSAVQRIGLSPLAAPEGTSSAPSPAPQSLRTAIGRCATRDLVHGRFSDAGSAVHPARPSCRRPTNLHLSGHWQHRIQAALIPRGNALAILSCAARPNYRGEGPSARMVPC